MNSIKLSLVLILLGASQAGCGNTSNKDSIHKPAKAKIETPVLSAADKQKLKTILDAQPENIQARYQYRNPAETIEFLGIKPGSNIVEALPGGGWYSRILVPYIGTGGQVIGMDYAKDMWPHFGGFATEEFIAKRAFWATEWKEKSKSWAGDDKATMLGYEFSNAPAEISKKADYVLFIRALHNLSRFEDKGQYLTKALQDTYKVLKPGGFVGIVQHSADESMPDDWAQGQNGYMKVSKVKEVMAKAGFVFVKSSDINANPNDKPTSEEFVWRLPPRLAGSKKNPTQAEVHKKIGESNRMTLVFQKPRS